MFDLSVMYRKVLDALVAAPVAWGTPAEVALTLGAGVKETTDVLCDLHVAGWIEVREDGDTLLVSLSPLGAERLDVYPVERGAGGPTRWVRRDAPSYTPRPAAPRAVQEARFDSTVDSVAGPLAAAVESERCAAMAVRLAESPIDPTKVKRSRHRVHADSLPAPAVLVGVGLTPWPGPGQAVAEEGVCPACGSKALRPQMYCLYCDRWGLDPLVGPIMGAVEPRRQVARRDTVLDQQERRLLRDRRRDKRLRRPSPPQGTTRPTPLGRPRGI